MQLGNSIDLLHDEHDHLTNRDKVEAERFNAFLALVFNTNDELWDPPGPDMGNHDCKNENIPAKAQIWFGFAALAGSL